MTTTSLCAAILLAMAALALGQMPPTPAVPAGLPLTFAVTTGVCTLAPTDLANTALSGVITFTRESSNTIQIVADLKGLDSMNTYNFHVHKYGVYSKDGMAAGPHLGNCNGFVCRPTAPAADQTNAGWMPNAPRNFRSDANGNFGITFTDHLLALNGYFSVIGRSVILHNGTGARVGFCVIGRGDTAAVEAAAPLVSETVLVPRRLACRLHPTADGINSGERVSGYVAVSAADADVGVNVSWLIGGFTPGAVHHFHVHQVGNIADNTSAMLTQGHFNGSCSDCRPGFPAKLQEVGQIGNGFELVVGSKMTTNGSFYDSLPQMRGLRSIVGRSIVVHGPGNNGAIRIAQCVLGIEIEPSIPLPVVPNDPPAISAALIGIVIGIAIVVIAANVWYFKYRKQQDSKSEYSLMESQQQS